MTGSCSDAVTALEVRIIKQIEYYFGDFNLSRNNFLKKKIQEDDGWVAMDTMLKFNRLKEITDNAQMVCDALKKSSSGLMEVSEQGDKIRRSPSKPLPGDTKERREEINARTVYAKPFPLGVKLDDLLEFFEGYGQLDKVFMKRHFQKKTLKRSVYVTFANKGDAAKFVNEEETKFKEQALEVKCFKTKYYKHKTEQNKATCKKDTEGNPYKKVEDETKEEEAEGDLEETVRQMMSKNAVLHLKGLNSKTSREQVLAHFSQHADVVWVDFNKCATEDYIIIREPDIVSSMLEKVNTANDGKVVIRGSTIEFRVVEGDEELQYWKKMVKGIANKMNVGGRGRRQAGRNQTRGRNQTDGRRNSGGPQGKRKHNKNKDSDGGGSDGEEQIKEEPPAKVIKSEKVITVSQDNMKENQNDASIDGEQQDLEEPPATVTNSEKVTTRSQGKRQQNKKNSLSDGEEQDTQEPPAKVTKSEKVITRAQGKRKQNKKDASSYGKEQDREEPSAKLTKSELVITRSQGKRQQNKKNSSSDGEQQDTEEPPVKGTKSEKFITRAQGKRKQNKKGYFE